MLHFDEARPAVRFDPGTKARSLAAFLELIHPDDRARVRTACERSLRDGSNFELEYRIVRPDGSFRWIEEKAEAFFDETGKPAYMTGACVDITKRKQAETFVWRQKDVLEQIVRGAPLADVLETLARSRKHRGARLIAMVMMADAEHVPETDRGSASQLDARRRSVRSRRWSVVRRRGVSERVVVPDDDLRFGKSCDSRAVKYGLRVLVDADCLVGRRRARRWPSIIRPAAPTDEEIRFVEIVTRTAAIAVERDRSEGILGPARRARATARGTRSRAHGNTGDRVELESFLQLP
jgi:hypothetical protein